METLGMSPDFWQGKRVLLTGHTGFKGSWLSAWLARMGARVCGIALPPQSLRSLFELASVAELLEASAFADICDTAAVTNLMSSFRPEVVFHLAAQPLVRLSYAQPLETYRVNVMGTATVLDAVRNTDSCRVVVVVTSDKCYENSEWSWGYRECDPLGGRDPYSSSKGCAELVTAAYRRSFFSSDQRQTAVASVRAGNVIGGGDFSMDRLVPDVMTALLSESPLRVRNPDALRPWQHVLDPLAGYLLLAEKMWRSPDKYSQTWNFGPSQEDSRSVRWLVERICVLWGKEPLWEADSKPAPHEAHLLTLDSSKARAVLGWHPRWTLDEALRAVVDWYRSYEQKGNVRDVLLKQISAYTSSTYSGPAAHQHPRIELPQSH
jgi:CDP-glucose 4,6-dehydratase